MAIRKDLKKNKVKPVKAFTGDALDAINKEPQKQQKGSASSDDKANGAPTPAQETPVVKTEEQPQEPKVTEEPKPVKSKKKPVKANENASTRASFIVNVNKLETLKDFIYAKKVSGDFRYTQEQGLDEALNLLFQTMDKIPPRPESERELERQRSENIKSGRHK